MPNIQIPGPGSAMGLAAAVGIYSIGKVIGQAIEKSEILPEKLLLGFILGGIIVVVAFGVFAYCVEKIHIKKDIKLKEIEVGKGTSK